MIFLLDRIFDPDHLVDGDEIRIFDEQGKLGPAVLWKNDQWMKKDTFPLEPFTQTIEPKQSFFFTKKGEGKIIFEESD